MATEDRLIAIPLPEVTRLAAPNIAAVETTSADDLQPLLVALAPGATNFLQHLMSALLMRNGSGARTKPDISVLHACCIEHSGMVRKV